MKCLLIRDEQIVNAYYSEALAYTSVQTVLGYLGRTGFLEALDLSKYRVNRNCGTVQGVLLSLSSTEQLMNQ